MNPVFRSNYGLFFREGALPVRAYWLGTAVCRCSATDTGCAVDQASMLPALWNSDSRGDDI